MKTTRRLLSWLAFAGCVSSLPAAPVVFNATESASALDVIGFQGSAFGAAPTVWIAAVNASGVAGAYADIGSVMTADGYVSAQIPSGYGNGLYQVVVKDDTGTASAPVSINRARITSAEFTEVDAGRQFRLFGRNLVVAGATPEVRFVDTTTLASVAGTVIAGGDRYEVAIQAPAALVTGRTYAIYYRNGLGGGAGEVSAPETILARSGGVDSFSLGMPWGADFGGFASNIYDVKTDSRLALKAVGDGTTDDTLAIQAAINTANTAGGGVVHLPAGVYRVATFGGTGGGVGLTLKSNVVLRGAGQSSTTLALEAPPTVSTTTGMISLASGASVMGIADLTIQSTTQITGSGTYPVITTAANSNRFFVLNVTIDGMNWAKGGIRLNTTSGGGGLLVSGCTIKNLRRDAYAIFTKDYGSAPNRTRDVHIRGCTFPNCTAGLMAGGNRIVFENNTIVFDGTYENDLEALGQAYNGLSRDRLNVSGPRIVVRNNEFSHTGASWIYGNNSENILGEDPAASGTLLGAVSSATSMTLTDATRAWTTDQFAGMDVVLLGGSGTGQVRTVVSNTATTITLNAPWDVPPTAGDNYTLTRMNVPHLLVKGNTMQGKRMMVLLYQGAYDAAIVDNIGVDSGPIWVRAKSSIARQIAHPIIKTLVAGNTLTATSAEKQSYVLIDAAYSETLRWGTISLLSEIRNNTVTAKGDEAYRAVVTNDNPLITHAAGDSTPQGTTGVIFDRNTAFEANTAYGWSSGIDGLTVSNATTADTHRDTYDVFHGDGRLIAGASLTGDGSLTNDGTGYVDLGAIEFPTAVTIEGRFKTAHNGPIISNRSIGKLVISLDAGKLKVWDNQFVGAAEITTSTYTDDAWHQFAWTSDGSLDRIFVDGTPQGTFARSRLASIGIATLGIDVPTVLDRPRFNGKLRDMRVWAGARSVAELDLYRDTKLAGDEPGLLQYWRLDEASGGVVRNHVLGAALSEGLVGYWRLDEGAGAVAADASGSGNTASLVNSPAWVSGEIGKALSFAGGASHVSVPHSASLGRTGSFTVHARVKIDAIGATWNANWRGIVSKGDPTTGAKLGWELGTFSPSGAAGPNPPVGFFVRRGTGTSTISVYSDTGLETGRFYTVDAVWDAAEGRTSLYVDGVLHASVLHAGAYAPSPEDLLIGKRVSGGAFSGVIDDIKVFDRALSAREINQLF